MTSEELTDDYVAKLLAKDAKESSIKYSALGLQAFAPSKPANKPKPNTRFLRNIIKDTDNHNAALLAKEAADSRARLQALSGKPEGIKKPVRVGAGDIRRRQLGDIAAILGGPSKRRKTEDNRKDTRPKHVNRSDDEEHQEEKSRPKRPRDRDDREGGNDKERARDRESRHRRHRSPSEDRGKDRFERRKRDRSRSRSPRERKEHDSRRRHRSPRRKRSPSSDEDRVRNREDRSHRRRRSTSREGRKERESHRATKEPDRKPDYDSDPLDDIIGPRPPPKIKIRGRGAPSQFSGIDARFSANYDPTVDVQLDPDEENDWDQALEALRDRQKWKQQGADRLRAAGFTEDEVSKWEKGGEKREADVKWAKKGEGREWDRGKVLDDDGAVKLESSFGRLTS